MGNLSRPFQIILVALIVLPTVFGQTSRRATQTQPLAARDFCFNVLRPGRGGCPVGEGVTAATPLLEAIRQRDISLVKRLLANGADVNEAAPGGVTPLMMASGGDLELIDVLLAAGADVNAESVYGETALIRSAACSRAVKKFLEVGARVNHQGRSKQTALMAAAQVGNLESLKILLAAGADISAKHSDGRSALTFAIGSGVIEVVEFLLRSGAKTELEDGPAASLALSTAVGHDDTLILKLLLTSGADVNGRDKYVVTGLRTAAMRNNLSAARVLLAAGADPNIVSQSPSPLTWAADYGHTDMVKLLIAAGANVNAKDSWPPINSAARKGHVETLKILVDAGGDVNALGYGSRTALMETAERGMVDVVKVLIDAKADVNLKNRYGDTALSLARKSAAAGYFKTMDEVIKMLLSAGATD